MSDLGNTIRLLGSAGLLSQSERKGTRTGILVFLELVLMTLMTVLPGLGRLIPRWEEELRELILVIREIRWGLDSMILKEDQVDPLTLLERKGTIP